jgi:hypothetical protein
LGGSELRVDYAVAQFPGELRSTRHGDLRGARQDTQSRWMLAWGKSTMRAAGATATSGAFEEAETSFVTNCQVSSDPSSPFLANSAFRLPFAPNSDIRFLTSPMSAPQILTDKTEPVLDFGYLPAAHETSAREFPNKLVF